MLRLQFLGATGTVTGSKYLVETDTTRVLVDCGLYQGIKQLRLRNWRRTPIEHDALDAVVLSHAHIDHSGYLPALVRDGYGGKIYCTTPTRDLCQLLLPDSGRIHEEDASYANRKEFSRHKPALPLYTEQDALRCLARLRCIDFGSWFRIGDLELRIQRAGHILGAGSVAIRSHGRTLLFSGDLGRDDDVLMWPPDRAGEVDWLVVESTYGGRLHQPLDPVQEVARIMRETFQRGGTLLIPSFAVGRAQAILYCVHRAMVQGLAPQVPVFLNSPMATSVTDLYRRHADEHRLTHDECAEVCNAATFVRSVEASKELTARGTLPAVIISASGMATAGRVLHHLRGLAPDPRNTILLPGFQAEGTRGEALARGVRDLKIHGSRVPVKAHVSHFDILSAHADQRGLLDWIATCDGAPRRTFITHGAPLAADLLRQAIEENFAFEAEVPDYRDVVELG